MAWSWLHRHALARLSAPVELRPHDAAPRRFCDSSRLDRRDRRTHDARASRHRRGPIATYLPQPLPAYEHYKDLADDPRWERLTARMLLAHTSGFANLAMFEDDKKLRFHFDPGTRFAYSGEGIEVRVP